MLRWQKVEGQDIDRVVAEARRAHAEVKRPILYAFLIPDTTDPPDKPTRERMLANFDAIFEHCEHMYGVVEGRSLRSTLNRTITRAMVTLSRYRTRTFVVATIDELLSHARDLDAPPATVR